MNLYDAFIEIVRQYALQAISGLTGFRLWVAKLLLKAFIVTLKKLGVLVNERIKAEERLKKAEQIANDPKTTPEERRDSDRDFIK